MKKLSKILLLAIAAQAGLAALFCGTVFYILVTTEASDA